ncbi:hypothetical protein ETB97_010620 [Aspergillus alliaceus]|uniref:GED domain-containing protein n=1 Tax=Petromyces alliaceus TaxID=209559 RepID=A0A8H6E0A7_PETAA|nr:hypothetical protein ETB97_010620 [Aspergillus burnettii]
MNTIPAITATITTTTGITTAGAIIFTLLELDDPDGTAVAMAGPDVSVVAVAGRVVGVDNAVPVPVSVPVVDDTHEILKSLYKVAIKCLNDNAVVQVVERCILGDEGAFQVLTPGLIGDMSDRSLEDIAGENYAISSAGNELVSKINWFQRGLEITRQAGI